MTAPIIHASRVYLYHDADPLRIVCYTDGGDTTRVEYRLRWDGYELRVEPVDDSSSMRLAAIRKAAPEVCAESVS